jgi:hypothetical protein
MQIIRTPRVYYVEMISASVHIWSVIPAAIVGVILSEP